jgi:hypothetical protein
MPRLAVLVLGLAAMAPAYSLSPGVCAGPTHHSGQVDTNEVWSPSGNPHILDADVYTGDSVTLTIMPGCTLQFAADVELYCGYASPGSIVAAGTADSVITFTALSDTVPGSWRSISFYYSTAATARMSYCEVLFGGRAGDGLGAVRVDDASIRFDHNLVRESGSNGVWVSTDGCFGGFANNTITGCERYAVHISSEYVRTLGAGNTLTGNARDGIEVRGGGVSTSGTWLNHGVPYVITDDVAVSDNVNVPILTIAAGAKLKMDPGTEFYVGYAAPGGLIADGTAEQITFTSSVPSAAPGDWFGFSFYGNSVSGQCRLINCKVEFGGGYHGDVLIEDCTPEVAGNSIGHSAAWGIYLLGSEYPDPAQLLATNTFYDCDSGAVGGPNVGIAETMRDVRVTTNTWPTVVCGVLSLPPSSLILHHSSLLDVSGRQVMSLSPGPNDVRSLAPGIYFVTQRGPGVQGFQGSGISKLAIAR